MSNSALSGRDAVVATRLKHGARVGWSRDTLIADYSGRELSFLAASGNIYTIPQEGEWYAVSTAVLPYAFTTDRWLPYYDERPFPNQTFRLGFTCQFDARVAHLRGLKQWICGKDSVTTGDLTRLMSVTLCDTVTTAIKGLGFSSKPSYEEYTQSQARLERASEDALFFVLYPHGLCMATGSLHISGFTKKYFELLQ